MRHRPMFRTAATLCIVALAALTAGCQSAYYGAMERLGKPKRDIMVERVEEARDEQQEAQVQFRSALDRFTAVTGFRGGDLERKYRELDTELERSERQAEAVRQRIESVREVSRALFDEWQDELEQYTDDDLRLSSEIRLRETQMRYARLMRAMRRAENRMEPVLETFRDQVLFLKHNLNAQAIASLGDAGAELETDVEQLVEEMEASIREADEFLNAMASPEFDDGA